MKNDRGEKEDTNKKFICRTLHECYPNVDEDFLYWSRRTSPLKEELQRRWEIRQSQAGEQPPVDKLSKAEEKTVKHGAKIVLEGLQRVGEIVHIIPK